MKVLVNTLVITILLFMTCLAPGTAFAQECVDNGNGTLTDNSLGVMLPKAAVGPMNWDAAMNYAASLSLGGYSGWRLPYTSELRGELRRSPCLSMMSIRDGEYWSRDAHPDLYSNAWMVDFSTNYLYHTLKSKELNVLVLRIIPPRPIWLKNSPN